MTGSRAAAGRTRRRTRVSTSTVESPAACKPSMGPAPNVSPSLSLSRARVCVRECARLRVISPFDCACVRARFCRGRGSWMERRSVGLSLSLSDQRSALKLSREGVRLIQSELG